MPAPVSWSKIAGKRKPRCKMRIWKLDRGYEDRIWRRGQRWERGLQDEYDGVREENRSGDDGEDGKQQEIGKKTNMVKRIGSKSFRPVTSPQKPILRNLQRTLPDGWLPYFHNPPSFVTKLLN